MRSARYGEMNDTMTISPASTNRRDDLGDAADVFHPVGFREAQIAVQPVADIVAVQDHGVMAQRVQAFFHLVGNGRFARAGQAR